jgi:hypothetical protein
MFIAALLVSNNQNGQRLDPHPSPPPARGREQGPLFLAGEGWGEGGLPDLIFQILQPRREWDALAYPILIPRGAWNE